MKIGSNISQEHILQILAWII